MRRLFSLVARETIGAIPLKKRFLRIKSFELDNVPSRLFHSARRSSSGLCIKFGAHRGILEKVQLEEKVSADKLADSHSHFAITRQCVKKVQKCKLVM